MLASDYDVIGHKLVQKKCFSAVRFPTGTDGRLRSPDICWSNYHTVFCSHSFIWIDISVNFLATVHLNRMFAKVSRSSVICELPTSCMCTGFFPEAVRSSRDRSSRDRSLLLLSGSWSCVLTAMPHMLSHMLSVSIWPYFKSLYHHCHHHLHH